jgi:hypothetical protein
LAANADVTGTDRAATALITAVDTIVMNGFLDMNPPAGLIRLFSIAGSRASANPRQKNFPRAAIAALSDGRLVPAAQPSCSVMNQELWLCGPASQRVCPSRLPWAERTRAQAGKQPDRLYVRPM